MTPRKHRLQFVNQGVHGLNEFREALNVHDMTIKFSIARPASATGRVL
jgi:hypothetical protein